MKRSKYSNLVKTDTCFIIHNPLYNSMIKVHHESLKDLTLQLFDDENKGFELDKSVDTDDKKEYYQQLIDSKILIDNNYNETNIVNYRYSLLRQHETLQVIILPTRQCNFRCPYCYDEFQDTVMSDETYNNSAEMIKNLVAHRSYKSVIISWFGGEPMLGYEKILSFMETLKETLPSDVHLRGHMTTNGYLLTKERFEKLLDVNVCDYQITVDGLAHTHNQTRYLVSKQGTWDVIIKNLTDAKSLEQPFDIMIRTNLTSEIMESIDEWTDYLSDTFGGDTRFRYHFETVKDLVNSKDKSHMYDTSKSDPTGEVLEVAVKKGLKTSSFLSFIYPFSIMCYAANPDSIIIDADGGIKKCTVALDSDNNCVGEVLENGNMKIIDYKFSWWTHYGKTDSCQDCGIFPICYGKKCPQAYFNPRSCDSLKEIYEGVIKSTYA